MKVYRFNEKVHSWRALFMFAINTAQQGTSDARFRGAARFGNANQSRRRPNNETITPNHPHYYPQRLTGLLHAAPAAHIPSAG